MGTLGALTGNPGIGSYIASRHGHQADGRIGNIGYGIRMNAVNPGLIDTQVPRDVVSGNEDVYNKLAKKVPIGVAGMPDEIASTVRWLAIRARAPRMVMPSPWTAE
jgi:NAD(P)-dependent dehydrogenase (short-subunit alcohol dehydrogenase family)